MLLHLIISSMQSLIAKFMGPTWGPPGAARTQVGPMLARRTLLSGACSIPQKPWTHKVKGITEPVIACWVHLFEGLSKMQWVPSFVFSCNKWSCICLSECYMSKVLIYSQLIIIVYFDIHYCQRKVINIENINSGLLLNSSSWKNIASMYHNSMRSHRWSMSNRTIAFNYAHFYAIG